MDQVEFTNGANSRRSFLTTSSGLALGFAIVPRSVLGARDTSRRANGSTSPELAPAEWAAATSRR